MQVSPAHQGIHETVSLVNSCALHTGPHSGPTINILCDDQRIFRNRRHRWNEKCVILHSSIHSISIQVWTPRNSIAITLSHAPLNFRNPCYFDFFSRALLSNRTGFRPRARQQLARCCNITLANWEGAACDSRCRNFPPASSFDYLGKRDKPKHWNRSHLK